MPEFKPYEDYYKEKRIFPNDDPDANKMNYIVPIIGKYSKLLVEHQFSDGTYIRNDREVELFPMSFNVAPNSGFITEPFEREIPLIGQCIKIYHHFYDIEYPMLFKITDVTTRNEDHNILNFVIPVQVKKNQPNKISNPFQITLDETINPGVTKNEYCNTKDSSFLIFAQDYETGEDLSGINISYQCVRFKCLIGQTAYQYFEGSQIKLSEEPFLNEIFPPCVNGILHAEKQGYLPTMMTEVTSDSNTGEEIITVELKELRKLDVNINVIELTTNTIRKLKPEEVVFIEVENEENEFSSSIFYPSTEDARNFNIFQLIYGDYNYNIRAVLMDEEMTIGGLQLSDYTITKSQLSGATEITFNIIVTGTRNVESFAEEWNTIITPRSLNNAPKLS